MENFESMRDFLFLFKSDKDVCEILVNEKLLNIWNFELTEQYRGSWYVALMFYIRNIQKKIIKNNSSNVFIPRGKGIKLVSYYMVLWLLKHHEDIFTKNYFIFVSEIGYFKDCLNLAKMSKDRGFTEHQITLLLKPMAESLMKDENKIIKANSMRINNLLNLSLAAKWAPREGKAFSEFIPYLKKLCNISGKDSQRQWREYISSISRRQPTPENILSKGQPNKINIYTTPYKARNLYRETFYKHPQLFKKYQTYVKDVNYNTCYKIINDNLETNADYYIGGYDGLDTTLFDKIQFDKPYHINNNNWKSFIETKRRPSDNMFIPVIDFNANKMNEILTTGLLMSLTNDGRLNRKCFLTSNDSKIIDICGDTMSEQIINIVSYKTNQRLIELNKILDNLLCFMLGTEATDDSQKTIVILTDKRRTDHTDLSWNILNYHACEQKYKGFGYQLPKIIYWNLSGKISYEPITYNEYNIGYLNGFDPHLLNVFFDINEIDPTLIPVHKISHYIPLAAI
jgi:hypothetical protein